MERTRFIIDNNYFEFKAKFERYGYCFYNGWHIGKQDNRDCLYIFEGQAAQARSMLLPTENYVEIYPEELEQCKIVFLGDIDKGERELTEEEKEKRKIVKETQDIHLKMKLIHPFIFNSNLHFLRGLQIQTKIYNIM